MTDDFYHYPHEDGSSYSIDIALPDNPEDKYHVDLVRQSQDKYGLQREQRQTLAQYKSYGEAEEHLYEAEEHLQKTGLADFDIEDIADLPYSDEPLLLAVVYPPDAEGDDITSAHLLALDANGLTTVPLARGDAETIQSVVAQLDTTQMTDGSEYLLDEAQELAQSNGQQPAHTPLFHPETRVYEQESPEPEYYFGYGIGPNNQPSLEAVKTWVDGEERYFDTLTVREYGMFEEAAVDEAELDELLETEGLESAMNLAESMAVAGNYLDPVRDDSRIFFEDEAPSDTFTTNRDRDLAEPRYVIGAISANGNSFLDVYKEWDAEDYERLIVPQPDWEQAQDTAIRANDLLDEDKLQSAMRLVELEAVKSGAIDAERDDPRLFKQGPPDPFETLAQRLQDEPNPHWNTDGEVIEEPEDDVQTPYWRLDTLPVNNPDGEALGHAMHMIVYDAVEHQPEQVGASHIGEDEPFRMLEMAHFETREAADEFSTEFNGYLMPGVLEGPELAKEVARLEGLPVEYETLEGQQLDDYRNAVLTVTRTPEQWRPYNPNAERDARFEAEGMYTDPKHVKEENENPHGISNLDL